MFSREQQLEVEEEFYSSQDAIRERYSAELRDLRMNNLIEQEYTEYMTKVWNAGFGYDHEAYEAYWKRAFKYYETETDQNIDRL